MQTEMSVKVEQRTTPKSDPVSILRFHGDITSTSKEAILDAYRALPADSRKIIFDFSKVDYLNSSGIAILIHILMEAHKADQVIHSFGLSAHFQKVFTMVGMTKYTNMCADETAAVASFE